MSAAALIPGDDLAQVAAWLVLLRDYLSGRTPPPGVRQPRVSPLLQRYIEDLNQAATEYQADRHRAAATRAPEPRPIGALAHLPPPLEPKETITVVDATDLLGCTRNT